MIDVSWCVSADHGGIPQFRLCDDEGLVSAVTTPGYAPTIADHEALVIAQSELWHAAVVRLCGIEE